jgi:uncharacterized Fe-S radical SAM superfamily protein PflX
MGVEQHSDILLKCCIDWVIVNYVSENFAASFFRILKQIQPEKEAKNTSEISVTAY